MRDQVKEQIDIQAKALKATSRFVEMWDDPVIAERSAKIAEQARLLCMALGVEATPGNLGGVIQMATLRGM